MKMWIPQMVLAHRAVCKGNERTPRHQHNYIQTGLVQSGYLVIYIDGHSAIEVKPNDFYCIAPHQEHIIAFPLKKDTLVLDLRFQLTPVDISATITRRREKKGFDKLVHYSFLIKKPHTPKLLPSLREMIDTTFLAGTARNYLLGLQLLDLSGRIASQPWVNPVRTKKEPPIHRAVSLALQMIQDGFRKPVDWSILADRAGVSVGHLNRLFQHYTGYSLHQFLIRYRIDQAKRLMMLAEGVHLKEIAYRTGFCDLQQFSRTFRHVEGRSPSRFFQ
jgi:AraC-like DNA-binding protein